MAATTDNNTPPVPAPIAYRDYAYRGFNTTVLTKADVTAATAWTTANSPVTLFTVSGLVLARVYGVVDTLLDSTSDNGTLAVGITGATALFLPATTANETNFTATSVWIDNSSTLKGEALAATSLTWALVNDTNIILTIATNNMTAGAMRLYCDWVPLTAGASVS